MRIGMWPSGVGCCWASTSWKCSPWKVTGSPVQSARTTSSVSPRRPTRTRAAVVPTPNTLELGGHRAPADPELEAATRRVVEGDRLTGEHGGMAEGVAQHEVADDEPLGVGHQPHGGGHGLVHRLRLGHRRGQVVHQRHAVEPGGLGGQGPLDQGVERQPHLRQEERELGACVIGRIAGDPGTPGRGDARRSAAVDVEVDGVGVGHRSRAAPGRCPSPSRHAVHHRQVLAACSGRPVVGEGLGGAERGRAGPSRSWRRCCAARSSDSATGSAPRLRARCARPRPTSWVLAAKSVLLMSFTARALPTVPVSKIAVGVGLDRGRAPERCRPGRRPSSP